MDAREHAIRTLLRWYPSAWRFANEEVMVSDLLDTLDATQNHRLPRKERLALMFNGLIHRLAHALPSELRGRVALNTFAMGLSFAMIYIGLHVWAPWAEAPYGYLPHSTLMGVFNEYGKFANPGVGYLATWGIAGVGALMARSLVTRIGLWLTIALSIASPIILSTHWISWIGPATETSVFMLVTAAIALIGPLGTPRRVFMRTAVMFGAWVWLYTFFIYYPTSEFVSDSWIWAFGLSPANLIAGLFIMGIISVALMLMRRGRQAASLALSSLPWIAVVAYSAPIAIIIGLVIAAVLAFAATGILAAARQAGYAVTRPSTLPRPADAPLPTWVWAVGLAILGTFIVWRLGFYVVETNNCLFPAGMGSLGLAVTCMTDAVTAEMGQLVGWGLALPAAAYLIAGLTQSIRSHFATAPTTA